MEQHVSVGYPTSDTFEETSLHRQLEAAVRVGRFSQLIHHYGDQRQTAAEHPPPEEFTWLPPEWPMGRSNLDLSGVSTLYKQIVFRHCYEYRLIYGYLAQETLEQFIEAGIIQTATLLGRFISSLFQGIDQIDFVTQYPQWQLLQQQDFWSKCFAAELSVSLHTTQVNRQRDTIGAPQDRDANSVLSFVINHDRSSRIGSNVLPLGQHEGLLSHGLLC